MKTAQVLAGGSAAVLAAIGLVVVARGSGIAAAFRDIGATRVISGG